MHSVELVMRRPAIPQVRHAIGRVHFTIIRAALVLCDDIVVLMHCLRNLRPAVALVLRYRHRLAIALVVYRDSSPA